MGSNMAIGENSDRLYHYTDPSGLCGILSGKLWASSYRFMNDAKEFEYAFDLITELYPPQKKTGMMPVPNSAFADQIKKYRWRYESDFLFVISFSENPDQLSQWRGYAGLHSGYSIGFSKRFLSSIHSSAELQQCEYNEDSQRAAVKKILDECIPSLSSKYHQHGLDPEYLDEVEKATAELVPLATRIKHPKFEEEREWRIVIQAIEEIKYRPSANAVVPYIELEIDPKKKPIEQIIVGPGPHKQRSKVTLEQMLQQFCFGDVEVVISEVPFVNW